MTAATLGSVAAQLGGNACVDQVDSLPNRRDRWLTDPARGEFIEIRGGTGIDGYFGRLTTLAQLGLVPGRQLQLRVSSTHPGRSAEQPCHRSSALARSTAGTIRALIWPPTSVPWSPA
jgi:hypothetical protein